MNKPGTSTVACYLKNADLDLADESVHARSRRFSKSKVPRAQRGHNDYDPKKTIPLSTNDHQIDRIRYSDLSFIEGKGSCRDLNSDDGIRFHLDWRDVSENLFRHNSS